MFFFLIGLLISLTGLVAMGLGNYTIVVAIAWRIMACELLGIVLMVAGIGMEIFIHKQK
jgi:hypothetical protein